MKKITITVVSNNPPGGRCTLYIRYAEELASSLGCIVQTIYPDETNQLNAPNLLLNDIAVAPADGVIIDANVLCKAIEQSGLIENDVSEIRQRLESLLEEILG